MSWVRLVEEGKISIFSVVVLRGFMLVLYGYPERLLRVYMKHNRTNHASSIRLSALVTYILQIHI